MEIVITFKLTHNAMKAKRKVLSDKLSAEIIPTPREISKECGFSLLFHDSTSEDVRDYLDTNELKFSKIYLRAVVEGVRKYEENN